jgi:hypothetical protein
LGGWEFDSNGVKTGRLSVKYPDKWLYHISNQLCTKACICPALPAGSLDSSPKFKLYHTAMCAVSCATDALLSMTTTGLVFTKTTSRHQCQPRITMKAHVKLNRYHYHYRREHAVPIMLNAPRTPIQNLSSPPVPTGLLTKWLLSHPSISS